MPKTPTGTVSLAGGVWSARVRLRDGKRPSFAMPWATSEEQAKARALQLAEVARQLTAADVPLDLIAKALTSVAGAASDRGLHIALKGVEAVAGKAVQPTGAPKVATFKELGERWTSGELAREYPDQVKLKRSAHNDVSRLTTHVYPVIGHLPVDAITLDDCEAVVKRLPADLETATRRNVLQLITRLLTIATYPLRLISSSPVPKGFLPRTSKKKAFGYLYPDEDRRLMACTQIPLEFRLLWGFLMREGMRSDEAASLVWSDLDLVRGAVRLDENKTDDPRQWALSPGVAEALRALRTKLRAQAKPSDHVFLRPEGHAIASVGIFKLPGILRRHLRLIGLQKERPELFTSSASRRQIRVHDLRASFITVALANGRSESWISDRTGHRSSIMIATYKRRARTVGELDLGDLAPLNEAIPELSPGPALDGGLDGGGNSASKSLVISNSCEGAGKGIRKRADLQAAATFDEFGTTLVQSGPVSAPAVQSRSNQLGSDPIAAALAAAIAAATQAGEWTVVKALAEQLEAREARKPSASVSVEPGPQSAPGVIDLEAERRRRT